MQDKHTPQTTLQKLSPKRKRYPLSKKFSLRGQLHVFKEFTPRDPRKKKEKKKRFNSRRTHTSVNPTKIIYKKEEESIKLEIFIKGTSTRF